MGSNEDVPIIPDCRHIPIDSTARAALLALRARSNGMNYVCPRERGPKSRDAREWFNEMLSQAEILNFRWHDLRHTFASRLVMAGVPLRTVQVLMGHKRIETTLRYSHLGEAHLREAVERLAATPASTTTSTDETRGPHRTFAATA